MKQTTRTWKKGSAGSVSRLGAAAVPAMAFVLSVAAPQIAQAQTPFHAIRPENGATVRETVRIQFSRRALEDSGVKYLSISVDGKFREALAVLPARTDGKAIHTPSLEVTRDVVNVLWNTKSANDNSANDKEGGQTMGVTDGPHKLEFVAQDANGKRLGVQELTLNVDNAGGMQVPAEGILLSYRFQVGDEAKYHEVASVEYIGERKAVQTPRFQGYNSQGYGQRGGFAGGFPGGPGGMGDGPGGPGGFGGGKGGMMGGGGPGMMGAGGGPGGFGGGPGFGGGFGAPGGGYAPGGDQSGPFKVPVQDVQADFERTTEDNVGDGLYFIRDRALKGIIIGGNGAAARLEDVYDFKSRYRTVLSSGFVKDYGVANAARPGAYIALPLPNLGGGRRRVGQTWKVQTPVLLEWATLDKPSVVFATNTLEGLEWQNGYQTARIKQTFNGKADIPIFGGAGKIRQANVEMDRTIWFAFKAGKIIRMETDMTVDGQAPAPVLAAMVPAAGVGGGGMGEMGGPGGGAGLAFPAALPGGAPDGMGGGPGNGGFGALQQQQQEQKAPAKFHSHTVVSLIIPGQGTK